MRNEKDERVNLDPLLDIVLEVVPKASGDVNNKFKAQVFNLAYDNFLGRLAIARVYDGIARVGETMMVRNGEGAIRSGKISKIFTFKGIQRVVSETAEAGDIVVIAGYPDIFIGETFVKDETVEAVTPIKVDEPTISLNFFVNDSPFAGREGKFVTSRQIRDRLEKELEVNVGMRVDFDGGDRYTVYGRGEMHVAVLLESMRREGYELQVSQPKVIIHTLADGSREEPYEEAVIDVPNEFSGIVMEKLGKRKGMITDMNEKQGVTRIKADIPTRGLLGYRGEFIIDTKGL
jgi:GTP-binding protein